MQAVIKRSSFVINIPSGLVEQWKNRLLHWAATFPVCVYLDSNSAHNHTQNQPMEKGWECLVAVGAKDLLACSVGQAFEALTQWKNNVGSDWMFGFMAYDLKNEVEALHSNHWDGVNMPDLAFFQPEIVITIRHHTLEIQVLEGDPEAVWQSVQQFSWPVDNSKWPSPELGPRMPKNQYIKTVEAIREHIIAGDLYEMNLCQEFYAEKTKIDPVAVFERLNGLAHSPFAAFMRWHDRCLLSASPERFLKKIGQKIISQPIKGTRKRGETPDED